MTPRHADERALTTVQRVEPSGDGHVVRYNPTVVEAWSTSRLPFEPRGWLIRFRQDLRAAVSGLAADDNKVLHAVYAGPGMQTVDVENVLLYNVGSKALRHLTHRGLRFERAQAPPPPPGDIAQDDTIYYHRYALAAPSAPFTHWVPGSTLGSFANVQVPRPARVGTIFTSIRRTTRSPTPSSTPPLRFGVRLTVSGSGVGNGRLVDLVKPLLDGVISAYHQHDGSNLRDLVARLDLAGLGTPDALRHELLDEHWNVLGRRRLLWPFRQGVQWNPADHLCLAADVSVRFGTTSRPAIQGEIVSLDERRPSVNPHIGP